MFKMPPYNFTTYSPNDCPFYKCSTYAIAGGSNPMCYDKQGKCNKYFNFNTFTSWIQEIVAEYNCPSNSCNRGQGCCDVQLTSAQNDFLIQLSLLNTTLSNVIQPNSFLSEMQTAIDNNDTSWGVSGGIIPGTILISKLNKYLSDNNIMIPFIDKLP
jgi:hypothetical protein